MSEPDSRDLWLAHAAAERGWLSPEQLQDTLESHARGDTKQAFVDWLQDRRLLTTEQVQALRSIQSERNRAATIVTGQPDTVPRADSAVALTRPAGAGVGTVAGLPSQFGPYQPIEELGRGGMGVVFRARDTRLDREVALKTTILGDHRDAERIERLQREARTGASLNHPAIVPIHDMGVTDGVPWFVMAFIHGRGLGELLRDRDPAGLRRRITALRDVAAAVGHAHAQRVIHRDLKPANVIVDLAGGVHVLDFGLARSLDDIQKITSTGQMLGTPQYMAPEQIEGNRAAIGPAADVFALGAMLYEALTGRPPIDGASALETLMIALAHEPVPPSRIAQDVPADLESVCMRALDPDAARRHPDAGEFAADLDRWLTGAPVGSRPFSWPRRWARRVRQHALPAALGATLLLSLAIAAWFASDVQDLRQHVRSDLRAKSQRFLDTALSLRRAGTPLERLDQELWPKMVAAAEAAQTEEPDRAEPMYHQGRLARAIFRYEDALACQQRALRLQPDYAPAVYEYAILTARFLAARMRVLRTRALQEAGARLFQTGEDPLLLSLPADAALELTDAEAPRLREELAAHLERLREHATSAPDSGAELRVAPHQIACAEALALACGSSRREDLQRAETQLRQVLLDAPGLEEAIEGVAAIAEAFSAWEAAEEAFALGIEADRGALPCWIGRGVSRLRAALIRAGRGLDPQADYATAESDLVRALDLDPGNPEALQQRGQLHTKWAQWLDSQGGDPRGHYVEALKHLKLTRGSPTALAEAQRLRGHAGVNYANVLKERGEDPQPVWDAAEHDYRSALAVLPADADAWMGVGALEANRGWWKERRGLDPDADYRRAQEALSEALKINPTSATAWSVRGQIRGHWAGTLTGRNHPADRVYADGIDDLAKAARLSPDHPDAWILLGEARINRALAQAHEGDDPSALTDEAIADLKRALDLNRQSAPAWMGLALAHLNLGAWLSDHGQDPIEMWELAEAEADQALELHPGLAAALARRGALRANRAGWRERHGTPDEAGFQAALDDFAAAFAAAPADVDHLLHATRIAITWATHLRARAASATPMLEQAQALTERARTLAPHRSETLVLLGIIATMRSAIARDAGGDAAPDRLHGMAWFAAAIALAPRNAEARWRRGHLFLEHQLWKEALADYQDAIEIDPGLADVLAPAMELIRTRLEEQAAWPIPLQQLQSAGDALKRGEYKLARLEYMGYLESFQASRTLPPEEQQRIYAPRYTRGAWFNLACVCAVLSTGRSSPIATPEGSTTGEPELLREQAFKALADAGRSIPLTRREVEADPDLKLLAIDPRWPALLAQLK